MRVNPKAVYERDADYLRETEWTAQAADVLDRRTKHGLHLSSEERAAFEHWCASRLARAG